MPRRHGAPHERQLITPPYFFADIFTAALRHAAGNNGVVRPAIADIFFRYATP